MDNKLGFKPIPAAIAVGLTLLIFFVIFIEKTGATVG